jgi:AraC family ethanolamine operon transcriptional activator
MQEIFHTFPGGEVIRGGNLQHFIDIELPTEVLRLWGAGTGKPESNRNHRALALERALQNIAEQPRAAMSVAELCERSACSLSTLERAFREYFGVSPKQYLTAQRLSGVRSSLLNPDNSRNISDVAAAWGFWHMSKFACDYKRMFGELPSRTRYNHKARAA